MHRVGGLGWRSLLTANLPGVRGRYLPFCLCPNSASSTSITCPYVSSLQHFVQAFVRTMIPSCSHRVHIVGCLEWHPHQLRYRAFFGVEKDSCCNKGMRWAGIAGVLVPGGRHSRIIANCISKITEHFCTSQVLYILVPFCLWLHVQFPFQHQFLIRLSYFDGKGLYLPCLCAVSAGAVLRLECVE